MTWGETASVNVNMKEETKQESRCFALTSIDLLDGALHTRADFSTDEQKRFERRLARMNKLAMEIDNWCDNIHPTAWREHNFAMMEEYKFLARNFNHWEDKSLPEAQPEKHQVQPRPNLQTPILREAKNEIDAEIKTIVSKSNSNNQPQQTRLFEF